MGGAEKALFRALKTRGNTPKYGLIFHSSFIGRAGAKNKGRISRYLANKCSIASRIDCFAETPTTVFGSKMKEQVEDRLKFYETGDLPRMWTSWPRPWRRPEKRPRQSRRRKRRRKRGRPRRKMATQPWTTVKTVPWTPARRRSLPKRKRKRRRRRRPKRARRPTTRRSRRRRKRRRRRTRRMRWKGRRCLSTDTPAPRPTETLLRRRRKRKISLWPSEHGICKFINNIVIIVFSLNIIF